MRSSLLAALLLLCPATLFAQTGPQALNPAVTIRSVLTNLPGPIRLVREPGTNALLLLTYDGKISRIRAPYFGQTREVVATPAEHGITGLIQGMDVGPDGTLYLVSNLVQGTLTTGIVRRGRPVTGGGRTWETVARTEPYARSNTPFDHSMSGIVLSPDGRSLYVNSGSRTDHGEVQSNGGAFPGLREVPLTSAILRIPADATDLLLRNDEAFLKSGGYLFADGVRNSFDLAFDAAGRLFGTENAGDRDDPEELNWLREGHHYGFPWRFGLNAFPMQFPGYDPSKDRLLNPASIAVQNGFFYNDPAFPAPPAGRVFTDPVLNRGPDANRYRDPADGSIRAATGQPFGTFTSHRSPLGLVFDVDGTMPPGFRGDGFVLSWTGDESPLLSPFGDEGEDLLHLRLQPTGDGFEATVTRLVKGFVNPIDAVQVGVRIYVVEFADNGGLWEVSFNTRGAVAGSDPVADWKVLIAPEPVGIGGRITFTAPAPQRVRVEVWSLLGQLEGVLFEGEVAAGDTRTAALDGLMLAPGVHVLRLAGTQGAQARPFVVR